MNDIEINISVVRLAEILGMSRRHVYNVLGKDITYNRVMEHLDDRIESGQENVARYVEAQRTFHAIHESMMGDD